jgi:hypothetical protein
MRTTIKIVILVQVILMATAAVLIFYPTTVSPPQEVTEEDLHMASLDDKETASTLEEAIKYLDEKEIWNRDEMEGFKELAGLWDALNTYKFDKIREYDLSKSENFTKLLEVIKGKNNLDKTRCAEGDFDISIAHYIKSLTSTPKTLSNPTNAKATPEQKNPESRNTIRSRNVEG